jgi:hypothetical protein
LSHAVAVVSPPTVPSGALPCAPAAPVQTAVALNAVVVPGPCFMDKIGDLKANAKGLDELVKLITHFTTPAGMCASNAADTTKKKRRLLIAFIKLKEASLQSLSTQYSEYKRAGVFEARYSNLKHKIEAIETQLVGLQEKLDALYFAGINGAYTLGSSII